MSTTRHLPVPARIAHSHELARRLGEPLLGGNRAEVLTDPVVARTALLDLLEQATDHLNLDAALLFTPGWCDALVASVNVLCLRGVEVQVLATAAQEAASDALPALQRAGATVKRLAPGGLLAGWMEQRTRPAQRQLAVVDGRLAWCGSGLRGGASDEAGTHLCVQGPIVQRLQRLFLERWRAQGERPALARAEYFPAITLAGEQPMGTAAPDGDGSASAQFGCPLTGALDTARQSAFISLGARVPPRGLRLAIAEAAGRGVSVSLLLADVNPRAWPWRAVCAEWARAGVSLYQSDARRPMPSHCVVDGVWSSVAIDGGAGWRSGRLDSAHRLIVLDATFATALEAAGQSAIAGALLLDTPAFQRTPEPARQVEHSGTDSAPTALL